MTGSFSSLLTGSHKIDFEVTSLNTPSGFSLKFGNFITGVFDQSFAFTGISGYLFDSEGDFIYGYEYNKPFKVECHVFSNRVSYWINGSVIKNNLTKDIGGVDSVIFEGKGSARISAKLPNFSGSSEGLLSSESYTLVSSEGYILVGSD